ncbi:MAG: alpha/beta hydrolase [Phormidesmis sp.]
MQATVGRAMAGLFAGLIFFLSLWIVLPAPNLFFLRLAVGAPEISPLLEGSSAIALIIVLATALPRPWYLPKKRFSRSARQRPWFRRFLVALLLATLGLSSLPLLRYQGTVAQAEQSMAIAFPTAFSQGRSTTPSHRFSWRTFFRGRPIPKVRQQTGIVFSQPTPQLPLSLDLYQPSRPGQYPVILTIYGGSWMRGTPAESERLSRFLAARGYVVAAIDYRHEPDHRFPAQLQDVRAALAFVRDHADDYEIDPNRIGLLGWSAGAHLAMLTGFQPGAKVQSKVQSIVSYYGPIDLTRGYADPPTPDPIDVRSVLVAFIGGTPDEQPAAYAQASPITYVNQAKPDALPPTLLIYGGRDHVVEAKFGRRLYDAMQNSGNRAVWVKIPWAEHAFDKVFNGVSNQLALHFIEQFLDQTLRG